MTPEFQDVAELVTLHADNARLRSLLEQTVEALEDYMDEYDAEARHPEAGCVECTAGTTPDRLNTGLCVYHKARAALQSAKGGGS